MCFAGYCLNIPHPPHDYGPVNQAPRLVPLSVRRDNFNITFIQRLIEGQVDAPRLLGELSFRIPGNTRLQCNFYILVNQWRKFS